MDIYCRRLLHIQQHFSCNRTNFTPLAIKSTLLYTASEIVYVANSEWEIRHSIYKFYFTPQLTETGHVAIHACNSNIPYQVLSTFPTAPHSLPIPGRLHRQNARCVPVATTAWHVDYLVWLRESLREQMINKHLQSTKNGVWPVSARKSTPRNEVVLQSTIWRLKWRRFAKAPVSSVIEERSVLCTIIEIIAKLLPVGDHLTQIVLGCLCIRRGGSGPLNSKEVLQLVHRLFTVV